MRPGESSPRTNAHRPTAGEHKEGYVQPALLVVDVQKQFFDFSPATAQSLRAAIEYINLAIALFRKNGLPIVSVQHVEEEDGLVPGAAGFDLPNELHVLPTDLHVHKTYGNSFTKTCLADEVREMDVDTVIVTGFCAEYCVLSTYHGAQDLDFAPILLRGSLASDNAKHIRFVEAICDVMSYGAPQRVLQ